jgi:hypothetical protein
MTRQHFGASIDILVEIEAVAHKPL